MYMSVVKIDLVTFVKYSRHSTVLYSSFRLFPLNFIALGDWLLGPVAQTGFDLHVRTVL